MAENILDIANNSPGAAYPYLYSTVRNNTNIQGGDIAQRAAGLGTLALAGFGGFPQVAQVGQAIIGESENYSIYRTYSSVPFNNLNNLPGIKYQDFRTRTGNLIATRLDGVGAASRGSKIAGFYAGASAGLGAYTLFNREGDKNFGAGWGDHDNPYALRSDFTAESNVATKWEQIGNVGKWVPKKNPLVQATPFRGDRVQVIDFGKRTLDNVYKWKPNILGAELPGALGQTQDFIKFFLTGPKLQPGSDQEDDIIVFRAILSSITDAYSPSWTPQQMIGRADPNFHYTGYGRSLDISFDVHATDRDEMKPIWRKLNALAGYTAPEYLKNSIAMKAPWMRITIGDLFYQQPVVISSLSYTLHDTDTTWEINIEQDPEMMQAPKKVSVTLGLNLITNELPQKNGKFYSLAKRFDEKGESISGNDNWLSDFERNPLTEEEARKKEEEEFRNALLNTLLGNNPE